jgi:hypothetical protein
MMTTILQKRRQIILPMNKFRVDLQYEHLSATFCDIHHDVCVLESNSKKLIPIHTHHDEYHKKWHSNVHIVKQHGSYELGS